MASQSVATWGIKLKGADNQNIRFLIRRCQRSLVAIPGYGIPLLRCLLPLAARHRSCLDALLTLATRLHASGSQITDIHAFAEDNLSEGSQNNNNTMLNRYQEMVSTLRSSLAQLQPGDDNTEEAIAMSMILWIFGFPSHDIWAVHLNGLIALLELNMVPSFDPSSLFLTASTSAAHADIRAFSLGRVESSRKLWLHWDIFPPGKIPVTEDQPFSSFQITSGYPESLVTIIAVLSAVVDSKLAGEAPDAVCQKYLTNLTTGLQGSKWKDAGKLTSLMSDPQCGDQEDELAATMELIIRTWQPPSIPTNLSIDTGLALVTSRDIMQKAALIYLWRGGFARDVLSVLTLHRQSLIDRLIPEMCLGIDQVIQLAEKYDITVANALIWPLAIVANECSRYPHLQPKVLDYIQRLYSYFMIPHHQILGFMIQQLWERASQGAYFGILSLQHICLKQNARLPLL